VHVMQQEKKQLMICMHADQGSSLEWTGDKQASNTQLAIL
jgi:hypothetical protein